MSGFTGSCLCQAVSYRSTADPMLAAHCQCADCRKSSGTGHCTHVVIPEDGFTVTGELRFFDHLADSGNMVSRGFCPNCGCAIYSRNSGMPGMVFPRASSLDDPNIITPKMVVYASGAPAWDHIDPALPKFAEMPEGGPEQAVKDHG
jgi:hypothetical protein